jgi:hypothetical protein
MFNWQQFTPLARLSVASANIQDDDLNAILTGSEPPPSNSDKVGRPAHNCARVSHHPDVANLKRVIAVRRSLAVDDENVSYIRYADQVLHFIDEISNSDPLYLISIATSSNFYQFFYNSKNERVICMPVGHIGNIGNQ